MTYIGVIASAVLHVGGLFLLLTARAPEPMIPMGTDSPVAVDIISVDEYNALVSRAPSQSTLAALRTQPEAPRAPVVADTDPVLDTLDETTPMPEPPEPATELAMRLPPAIEDAAPEMEDEPPAPEESEVEVSSAPDPLALDTAALQDKGVDPADLIPNDDVQVAIAPPAPEPPRGVFDAPVIDTDPDEPPKPAETEGEGEDQAEPAPEPEPTIEKPIETAKAEDPAPLATPLPVPKPRGSLTVASDEEREPAKIAEATPPVPPRPKPPLVEQPPPAPDPVPKAIPKPAPAPDLQLTEAELEEERRMMAALMEQMRANQPPSEAELRAAEADARRKFAEEQQRLAQEFAEEQRRQAELAALNEAERRKRIEQDRAKAAAEAAVRAAADAAARAEAERRARELAEAQAREIAALREREAQQLRAQQEAALRMQREQDEARRQQALEAQRLAQEQLERQQREEAARRQAERDRANRRQQLANLNANIAPETRATNVLTGSAPAPAAPQQDSFLGGDQTMASILGAAANAAQSASTGPSFGQGGSGGNRGVSLTQGETQAVLNQLRRCWRVDTFSANARSLVVTMRAQIRQNGFVNQATIDLVSPNPIPADYQIAVDRARTALQDVRCQPFALPANKYNAWRDIVIRFDPAQMVLQ